MIPPPPGVWLNKNSVILLYATPKTSEGYVFAGWSGNYFGTANPDTIVVNGPRQVSANFFVQTHEISISILPENTGSILRIPNKSTFFNGEMVQLKAIPTTGYAFDFWSGDLSGMVNPATLLVSGNKNVTAHFKLTSTGVDAESFEKSVPNKFLLEQNYPNPFNSKTLIRFHISETDRVSLCVFNMKGERIRTLVDEIKPPGVYQAVWDDMSYNEREVSAGTYVVVLRSGNRVQKMKMVFMK